MFWKENFQLCHHKWKASTKFVIRVFPRRKWNLFGWNSVIFFGKIFQFICIDLHMGRNEYTLRYMYLYSISISQAYISTALALWSALIPSKFIWACYNLITKTRSIRFPSKTQRLFSFTVAKKAARKCVKNSALAFRLERFEILFLEPEFASVHICVYGMWASMSEGYPPLSNVHGTFAYVKAIQDAFLINTHPW